MRTTYWGWLGLLTLLVSSEAARAHPVAFRGSVGVMGYHSKDMTDLELNYSVRHWFAPSVQALRFTEGTNQPDAWLGKANFLLYRRNGEASQLNVYGRLGGGYARLNGGGGAYSAGFTADAENRQLYFLAQADTLRRGSDTLATFWKARVGFAPYVTGFEQLHTWLVLEANQKSLGEKRVNLVPTLRFFYQNVLWEVGSTLSGDLHLNYIIHI